MRLCVLPHSHKGLPDVPVRVWWQVGGVVVKVFAPAFYEDVVRTGSGRQKVAPTQKVFQGWTSQKVHRSTHPESDECCFSAEKSVSEIPGFPQISSFERVE